MFMPGLILPFAAVARDDRPFGLAAVTRRRDGAGTAIAGKRVGAQW